MKRAKELTQNQLEEIKRLNKEGWSTKQIYEQMGITKSQAYKAIRRMGLKSNCNRTMTPDSIKIIKEKYLEGETIEEITDKYFKDKYCSGEINMVLRKLGITRPNGIQAKINHDYFENIDSEHKAYWLGFIYADGSITKKAYEKGSYTYRLRMELMFEDKYILEQMALDLESDLKPKEYYNDTSSFEGYNKPKHTAYIMFSSKKMGEDLVKLGVVPNKTLILKSLPSIPDNLMKHFIRGFFDGDGSITKTYSKTYNKYIFGINITSTQKICEWLQYLFDFGSIVKEKRTEKTYYFSFGGNNQLEYFYHYLYDNATIWMDRKYNKFQEFLKISRK